jgi:hypothetical protein
VATAFVLDDPGLAGGGPVNLAGFPGVWTPDQPIEAEAFVANGAFDSVDEMRDRVDELGLPLKEVDVAEGSAPMPARAEGHAPNAEEAAAAKAAVQDRTPRTHAEANQIGLELGLEFAPDAKLAEKVDAIKQALDQADADAPEGAEA